MKSIDDEEKQVQQDIEAERKAEKEASEEEKKEPAIMKWLRIAGIVIILTLGIVSFFKMNWIKDRFIDFVRWL